MSRICSSSTSGWMSQCSAVFIEIFTKMSKVDSLVLPARILRLLSPSILYSTCTLSIPTELDTVALDTSQELRPEQANSRCQRAPSPVKTAESPSDVGLNVSPAKQSLEETSSPPQRRSDRRRKERQEECGDCV